MKKYGLPTFPIYNGMDIGYLRGDEELKWLLTFGYFIDTPIAFYRKIVMQNGDYVLLSGSHEKHLAAHGETELDRKPTLEKLLKSKKRSQSSLARWQWFGDEESEK